MKAHITSENTSEVYRGGDINRDSDEGEGGDWGGEITARVTYVYVVGIDIIRTGVCKQRVELDSVAIIWNAKKGVLLIQKRIRNYFNKLKASSISDDCWFQLIQSDQSLIFKLNQSIQSSIQSHCSYQTDPTGQLFSALHQMTHLNHWTLCKLVRWSR